MGGKNPSTSAPTSQFSAVNPVRNVCGWTLFTKGGTVPSFHLLHHHYHHLRGSSPPQCTHHELFSGFFVAVLCLCPHPAGAVLDHLDKATAPHTTTTTPPTNECHHPGTSTTTTSPPGPMRKVTLASPRSSDLRRPPCALLQHAQEISPMNCTPARGEFQERAHAEARCLSCRSPNSHRRHPPLSVLLHKSPNFYPWPPVYWFTPVHGGPSFFQHGSVHAQLLNRQTEMNQYMV